VSARCRPSSAVSCWAARALGKYPHLRGTSKCALQQFAVIPGPLFEFFFQICDFGRLNKPALETVFPSRRSEGINRALQLLMGLPGQALPADSPRPQWPGQYMFVIRLTLDLGRGLGSCEVCPLDAIDHLGGLVRRGGGGGGGKKFSLVAS